MELGSSESLKQKEIDVKGSSRRWSTVKQQIASSLTFRKRGQSVEGVMVQVSRKISPEKIPDDPLSQVGRQEGAMRRGGRTVQQLERG